MNQSDEYILICIYDISRKCVYIDMHALIFNWPNFLDNPRSNINDERMGVPKTYSRIFCLIFHHPLRLRPYFNYALFVPGAVNCQLSPQNNIAIRICFQFFWKILCLFFSFIYIFRLSEHCFFKNGICTKYPEFFSQKMCVASAHGRHVCCLRPSKKSARAEI